MKNLKWYLITSLIGLVSISGIWLFIGSLHQDRPDRSDADFIQSSVPTFFLHGWKSSYHAEQQMVNYAKKKRRYYQYHRGPGSSFRSSDPFPKSEFCGQESHHYD